MEKITFSIGSEIKRILVQFSFSSKQAVPEEISLAGPETVDESQQRKLMRGGQVIVQPKEKCQLKDLLDQLKKTGFILVDALCQERLRKPGTGPKRYRMVRFVFVRYQDIEIDSDDKYYLDTVEESLEGLLEGALWRLRVYKNHLEDDDYALSFNLEARVPLYNQDGNLIKIWPKDETGRKRKDLKKIPIMGNYEVKIV